MIETKRLKNKNIKWSNSNSSSREDKHSSEKLADKLKMSSKKNTYSHKQQKIRSRKIPRMLVQAFLETT